LDGFVDLMVVNYVDFHLDDMPKFGAHRSANTGAGCAVRPRGLRARRLALSQQRRRTFTDVSKAAGVSDPDGYYGSVCVGGFQ